MVDHLHSMTKLDIDPACGAFGEEQVDDLSRRTVAEQLAEGLFVPRDAMTIDQSDEVRRSVAGQRRLGEVGVGAEVAVGRGVAVGEVAPPPARDQDLLSRRIGMVDQQHPPTAFSGLRRAQESGSAGADDDRVESFGRAGQPAGHRAGFANGI